MSDPARLPVTVLFNQPSVRTRAEDRVAEAGVLDVVGAAVAALARAGYDVETLGIGDDAPALLSRLPRPPAAVMNFCEGVGGRAAGEGHVAGLLELLGLPYTGSPPDAIALCLNKIRTKLLLAGAGLPTPPFLAIEPAHLSGSAAALARLLGERSVCFPAIVKPAAEDASQGIGQASVVEDLNALRTAAARVAAAYGFPVLAERYVPGREFNVGIVEDPSPRVLPLSEIVFDTGWTRYPIVTYEAKWVAGSADDRATVPRCPAELDDATTQELARVGLAAYRLTGCRDYARVDLRLSPDGRPYVLEVNANPDLSAQCAGLSRQLAAAGIAYDAFIVGLVERAVARVHGASPVPSGRSGSGVRPDPARPAAAPRAPAIAYRGLRTEDRAAIAGILERCGNFRPEEIAIGLELADEALGTPDQQEYQFRIAEREGRVVGFVCFGPVPLTEATWDLYWIAADPAEHGRGVGARMQAEIEQAVRSRGGRLLLAETSSLPAYAPARAFYLRQGYQLLERIADFYRPGDDRLTFGKRLA